jgi:hypothetical protein
MICRVPLVCWLLGVFVCATVAGCSSGPREGPVVLVTGKLTNKGVPLEVKKGTGLAGGVEVVFSAYTEGGKRPDPSKIFPAEVNADGSFKLGGRFGRGIPLGKYRIGVHQYEPVERKPGVKMPKGVSARGVDLLQGKFDDLTSPIVREITEKDTTIEIDISKPQG